MVSFPLTIGTRTPSVVRSGHARNLGRGTRQRRPIGWARSGPEATLTHFYIGTAGWSIPKQHAEAFPDKGSHLARYASRFPAVEINSSFYRPHRAATYQRWTASVPPGFRFSVKVPRKVRHIRRLGSPEDLLFRLGA
jgi:hypothetical protein